jgi:hypothetical protein
MTGNIDLLRIWEKQSVPETVKDVLRGWAVPMYEQLVNSAGGRNVTEWCKKPDCWNGVRAMSLLTDVDLSRFGGQHVAGLTGDGGLVDVDDAAAISECMRLSVNEWEKLMAWVFRAERVHPISRGIASTLRMYALDNWSKAPSVKQARSASKLIRRWRAEEGLESATNFTA